MSACLCMCICVSGCMCAYVCVNMCMYVYVYVYVHMYMLLWRFFDGFCADPPATASFVMVFDFLPRTRVPNARYRDQGLN